MFAATDNKGFHIEFSNGITISVQFGAANYCEHYDDVIGSERGHHKWESSDAEVAIWTSENVWITEQVCNAIGVEDAGEVVGRVSADQVGQMITYIQAM